MKDQGLKAMFWLLAKSRNLHLPTDCLFKAFDHMVVPILLYGCEVWGYSDYKKLEFVHRKFIKRILHLRKSTPAYMLYGETGRLPLSIIVKKRVLSYYYHIRL